MRATSCGFKSRLWYSIKKGFSLISTRTLFCFLLQQVTKQVTSLGLRWICIAGSSYAACNRLDEVKFLVARAIFQFSGRSDKPFLAVNCAAIPDALLESELFGHEKGAFTGAESRRIGKFEQCNGGTLFLDEIGDMDAQLQSKLLRVLQEKQFERVGGNETLSADIRIVAATHRNLEQMCKANQFREDLYYRLNGFTIQLPALRERGSDLNLLIDFFRTQANDELGKSIMRIEPAATEQLQNYSWPGNVRELQSVIRQAIVQSSGTVMLADFLPDHFFAANRIESAPENLTPFTIRQSAPVKFDGESETVDQLIERHRKSTSPTLFDNIIEEVERKLIAAVLDETAGNQT